MDIHKPKSVHSWREFLKEYAIIVLGVATALAAEQAVEWLHWQGEVKAARQAIYAEIATNSYNLFSHRLGFTRCFERQADEAGRILDDLEAKRPPGRLTTFHTSYSSALRDSDWQSERSAGSLTHFPRDELALIGRYYAVFGRVDGWTVDERDAWRTLSVLRHPPKEIAAGDLLRLRAALMTARDTQGLIVLNSARELRLTRQLGIAVAPLEPAAVEKFCALDQEEYQKYLQSYEPH
jgi:hypothetical protein